MCVYVSVCVGGGRLKVGWRRSSAREPARNSLHICVRNPARDETECVKRSDRLERERGRRASCEARFLTHVLAAKGVFDAALVAGMRRG